MTTNSALDYIVAVETAVRALAKGDIIIVTDDINRENEGDLVMAASLATPEKIAFIIRHSCGILCAPLRQAAAERLQLSPMVASNEAPLGTAFTVSVDCRHGLTTGISAKERSTTFNALGNGLTTSADFVRPGHVFPLIAKDQGVLVRSGHTEAAVDLVTLAGLEPVGVICELVNDNGTLKRNGAITAFANCHGLPVLSIASLIAFRHQKG